MLILPNRRRGFTLIEVMIALVTLLVVAGALHQLLLITQRLTRTQAHQMSLQSSVRAGYLVLTSELRELSTMPGGASDQNDILHIAPSALTYRAMRGLGFVCQTTTAGEIRIGRSDFSGHRDPQPGRDTAYVWTGGNAAELERSWTPVAVSGVSTAHACPGALGPGITLAVFSAAPVEGLEAGTPVRISEIMELRLYESEDQSWLGVRSVSAGEAIQPVAGPLSAGNGLRLEYLNASGAPTTNLQDIKSIRVALRGTVEAAGGGTEIPGRLEEELRSQVTLRNAARQ
ncbi:MAG: PilW family protein [Gemmatimonadales bacterium]